MRQAYDYWQDQPGNYRFLHPATKPGRRYRDRWGPFAAGRVITRRTRSHHARPAHHRSVGCPAKAGPTLTGEQPERPLSPGPTNFQGREGLPWRETPPPQSEDCQRPKAYRPQTQADLRVARCFRFDPSARNPQPSHSRGARRIRTAPASTGTPPSPLQERTGARPISRSQNQLYTSSRSSRRINGSDKEIPASPPSAGGTGKTCGTPMPTRHVPSCTKHHPVNLNQGEGIFTEHHTRQWHYFTPITRGQVHPSIDYPEEDHQFQGLSQSLPPFSSKSHNLSCTPMITQPHSIQEEPGS